MTVECERSRERPRVVVSDEVAEIRKEQAVTMYIEFKAEVSEKYIINILASYRSQYFEDVLR